ncbi:hypothetical protein K440DRAFT_174847 [Wilcoxina mikolae CBS 423.85]|nr:hypothetical protein K440DRAFT_174847 [Wilcoxina mikolae CBS 423.85]
MQCTQAPDCLSWLTPFHSSSRLPKFFSRLSMREFISGTLYRSFHYSKRASIFTNGILHRPYPPAPIPLPAIDFDVNSMFSVLRMDRMKRQMNRGVCRVFERGCCRAREKTLTEAWGRLPQIRVGPR